MRSRYFQPQTRKKRPLDLRPRLVLFIGISAIKIGRSTFILLALLPFAAWVAGSAQERVFQADSTTRSLSQNSLTHNERDSEMSAVKQKICIIGSGNWGSCVAKIIGANIQTLSAVREWEPTVNMWVYEEKLENGELLSEVINSKHENVKYGVTFQVLSFSSTDTCTCLGICPV